MIAATFVVLFAVGILVGYLFGKWRADQRIDTFFADHTRGDLANAVAAMQPQWEIGLLSKDAWKLFSERLQEGESIYIYPREED